MNLQELTLYTSLATDPIITKYLKFVQSTCLDEIRKTYYELIKALISIDQSFQAYFYTRMIEETNPILERLSIENEEINMLDKACLKNDLVIIDAIIHYDIEAKIKKANDEYNLYMLLKETKSTSNLINAYIDYFNSQISVSTEEGVAEFIHLLRKYGTGVFANHQVFYVNQEKQLSPLKEFIPLSWKEIYGYSKQKEAIQKNTEALVNGQSFHHVLLEGASGTGKSSCVKAVADLYRDQKLRLIQLYKSQLTLLPSLFERLNKSIFKFIIFLDDLSFEANEDEYKLLKSYIEGGISNESTNIAFYVTSNRQHLIKEIRADREGDLHLQDSIQETTSLSARFGLHLTFTKLNQDEYVSMIIHMLEKSCIAFNQEDLLLEAKRWALTHRGMSGRIAMQFVKHFKMNAGRRGELIRKH